MIRTALKNLLGLLAVFVLTGVLLALAFVARGLVSGR